MIKYKTEKDSVCVHMCVCHNPQPSTCVCCTVPFSVAHPTHIQALQAASSASVCVSGCVCVCVCVYVCECENQAHALSKVCVSLRVCVCVRCLHGETFLISFPRSFNTSP